MVGAGEAGPVQGRVAIRITGVDLEMASTVLKEVVDYSRLVALGSEVQAVYSQVILKEEVRANRHQLLHQVEVAIEGREVDGRELLILLL